MKTKLSMFQNHANKRSSVVIEGEHNGAGESTQNFKDAAPETKFHRTDSNEADEADNILAERFKTINEEDENRVFLTNNADILKEKS